jgi:hypothetical protein
MKAPKPKSGRLLVQSPRGASSQPARQPQLCQPQLWKIENTDPNALWRALHRMVSHHPLVRSALSSQQASKYSTFIFSLHDLTQDLYLLLLQKGRFDHYLAKQMTDAEIEREIFQIELTNLLIGSLRRRRPENYRIVRRVSSVLESQPPFRRFKQRERQPARYRSAADAVYGLREWQDNKLVKDSGTFNDLIAGIPMRMRNRRRAGCSGEAQVIVSQSELVELMIEIFHAIDSPAPLRVLRQLALSKLPVYDLVMTSIDDEIDEERRGRHYQDLFASPEVSPEQLALRVEQEEAARRAAANFLHHLSLLVRSNSRRTERLWRVLWHFYFDPAEPSQLEIAEIIGISDSSVSDYRRKLDAEMQKLDLAPEQLRYFAEELDEILRWRLSLHAQDPHFKESVSDPYWPQLDYKPISQPRTSLTV